MFNKIEEWIDSLPLSQLPENTKAFNFNLYEDGDNWWSIELVATDRFDVLDQDWACDEIADFGTRDNPFSWEEEADWNDIQEEMNNALKQYLEEGKGRSASNEMCIFLIINMSSLQLIPVNMIAYRSQYGSVNPAMIVAPAIVATLVSTVIAVGYCKLMDGKGKKEGRI